MQILICFYSLYGHVYELAREIEKGANEAGATVKLRFVQETLPEDVLLKMGAAPAEKRGAHLPLVSPDDLVDSAGIIFGSPTRFGGMCAQMRTFLDKCGGVWAKNALEGKVGSAFTSTATQHGGQETTIFSFHTFMLHQGMLIGGAPFSCPALSNISEVSGGTPYGASAITGSDGSRQVSENERIIARYQGAFITKIAKKLAS